VQDFRRLIVWQKANEFAADIVAAFPAQRCRSVPGFRAQIVRASGSIPDLIAEGCGKASRWELARYTDMAGGSASEVRSQLARAVRLGLISDSAGARLDGCADEIRRMLFALAKSIRLQEDKPPTHT
jgi:four helix bundle protein